MKEIAYFNAPIDDRAFAGSGQSGSPCAGRPATIAATAKRTRGTKATDVIRGRKAADRITAGGGRDTVCGKAGRDRIKGGQGRDKLRGARGRDRLVGGPGRDRLHCGPGRRDVAVAGPRDRIRACEKRRRS